MDSSRAESRRPTIGISPHTVDPQDVFSAAEIELFHRKFALFNPNANKTRSLATAQAIKLFRDDFPSLSEWEIHELFQKCDLNCDGLLSLREYLRARAFHRLVMEHSSELELVRSFTILDTDSDGLLVADDVLQLVDQAKQPGERLLKLVILQAAQATSHSHESQDGEITLEHFVTTIRDVNRAVEQDIATKTLRLLALQDKLVHLQAKLQDESLGLSMLQRGQVTAKMNATRVEVDVLTHETTRARRELVSDSHSGALARVCETLVATYENEQYVYECLSNLLTYCGLKDATLLRYNMEQSGRAVHILDSILLKPPSHAIKSPEYAAMQELAIHHLHEAPSPGSSSSMPTPIDKRIHHLAINATLRKQFVYYTMLGDVTNVESMTRTSFGKFVWHCNLHEVATPPLTDPDIGGIFARANGVSPLMTFEQWLVACELIFSLIQATSSHLDSFESFMKTHVLPKAQIIKCQNIAPDVSQLHVLKLLRESLWPLRQLFCHFTEQSLLDVASIATMDMKRFLCFARSFNIVRASAERDGEPYSPPPLSESTVIQPISLMELVREFYAAKLDISLANPHRRDTLDLDFREFLRCLQRIALAMHARRPSRHRRNAPSNGINTTSFEALNEDDERAAHRSDSPLHQRRGNLLGMASSLTKNCKMTSTSIISKLLHATRAAVASTGETRSATIPTPLSPRSRSPTKIFYGNCVVASAIPVIQLAVQQEEAELRRLSSISPRSAVASHCQRDEHPASPRPSQPENDNFKVCTPPRTPRTPRTPRRPVTGGASPVVKIIRPPSVT